MSKILAFDMGIRNLAYCVCTNDSGGAFVIEDWDNYDLLAGSDSQTASRCACGGPPSWVSAEQAILCKKCVKKGEIKGLPSTLSLTIKGLKTFCSEQGWTVAKAAKKDDYMALVKQHYLLPYVKPKGTMKTDLSVLLLALEKFIDSRIGAFSTVTEIRIENQPAFDAPTMKSVQIILFTLLHHRLRVEKGWLGKIVFVHASKKTEEAQEEVVAAGDNYKARKDMAETLVLQKLKGAAHVHWLEFFNSKKKKSDLADALLMCLR